MPEKDKERLLHIIDSAQKIVKYVKDGKRDTKTEDAIVRRIEIIGEAANHISKEVKKKHPEIVWKDIIGMRNILIHQYFDTESSVIWYVAKHEVPELIKKVKNILRNIK